MEALSQQLRPLLAHAVSYFQKQLKSTVNGMGRVAFNWLSKRMRFHQRGQVVPIFLLLISFSSKGELSNNPHTISPLTSYQPQAD